MSSRREGLSSGKSGLDMHRNVKLSDEEVDAIIQGFAQDDEDTSKTLTRRAVESYLQHVSTNYHQQLFHFPGSSSLFFSPCDS